MPYAIHLLPSVEKTLERIPRRQRAQIGARIDALALDPFPPTCIKLQGLVATYRLPAGDFRILYQVKQTLLLVVVVKVGNRKDVYRNL